MYKIHIVALALFFAFVSCKKDSNILGVGTQPANDVLNAGFDNSSKIYTYTKRFDSVGSFNTRLKYLGYNNDPYFGSTDVGLYVNANSILTYTPFGSNVYLTSAEIVLAIDLTNSAGNVNSTLNYSVYTIDSTLYSTRLYYTNSKNFYSQSGLNKVSSQTYTTLASHQVLRIPVDSTFASNMLKSNYLTSNEVFQKQYKGFYIKCAAQSGSEGVIYKCNLEDDLSGFYLHYRAGTTAADTVQSVKFSFSGSTAARFNTVKCDYTNATPALKNQLAGDTTAGANNLFLKGLGSAKVRVYIPSLVSYADSFKVAVNRAELMFYLDPAFAAGSTNIYNHPLKLALLPLDSAGRETFATDQISTTDLARYDGGYDSDNKRYVFNIARHVQAVLSGTKKNYGFNLVIADPDPTYTFLRDNYVERVALFGGSNAAYKPVLNMSYIKFKHDK
ncbi:MAG: DUF4270 family protein [Bacteroidia bacterium]|nr:DUF4270 family protein [Bacteroidia bacterium]